MLPIVASIHSVNGVCVLAGSWKTKSHCHLSFFSPVIKLQALQALNQTKMRHYHNLETRYVTLTEIPEPIYHSRHFQMESPAKI